MGLLKMDSRRIPKQQRARDKYHRILGASIVVLEREGYAGTNTSNIAREANVAVGSLYEYFPNKESIFTAFLSSQFESILGSISQSAALLSFDGVSTAPTLKDWLLLILEASQTNRNLLKVLVDEVPGVLDLLSSQNLEGQLLSIAKYLAVGGDISEEALSVKTYILSNALYGFILRSFFSETHLQVDQLADEWSKLILAYADVQ